MLGTRFVQSVEEVWCCTYIFCYSNTAIWFRSSTERLYRGTHILKPCQNCRWTEVEVVCLLYWRKACKILEENSSNLFSTPFSLHFRFVLGKWNAKTGGQWSACTLQRSHQRVIFLFILFSSLLWLLHLIIHLLQCLCWCTNNISMLQSLLVQRLVLIEAIYSTRAEDGLFILLYNEY